MQMKMIILIQHAEKKSSSSKIYEMNELKKWRAIRASVGGVGGVLAWVTC